MASVLAWAGDVFERVKRDVARRRLRHQLAGMRENLLLDIGVAEDEIYRVREHHDFMPRAWTDRVSARQAGHRA